MLPVLTTSLSLAPGSHVAFIADTTGLQVGSSYTIVANYIPSDTTFIFYGTTEIVLTNPSSGVPPEGVSVLAEIGATGVPAIYPYTVTDRLHAGNLNLDFEHSPNILPPHGNGGGAGKFKYWMDTSVTPQQLRIARVRNTVPGVYIASEWTTIAVFDPSTGRWSPVVGGMTAAELAAYTPLPGELILDTTNGALVVGGATGSRYFNSTGSNISMASGVVTTVTSVSLPAGKWIAGGSVEFNAGTALDYKYVAGVSQVAANLPPPPFCAQLSPNGATSGNDWAMTVPEQLFDLASPAPLYLMAHADFGGGVSSITATGFLNVKSR